MYLYNNKFIYINLSIYNVNYLINFIVTHRMSDTKLYVHYYFFRDKLY